MDIQPDRSEDGVFGGGRTDELAWCRRLDDSFDSAAGPV